jgi:hypothetical protein
MPGGVDTVQSRRTFEDRFRVADGDVNFHSHLGDVAIVGLDAAFGRTGESPAQAFGALSRLAGLVFLIELGVAAAWHRWSHPRSRPRVVHAPDRGGRSGRRAGSCRAAPAEGC